MTHAWTAEAVYELVKGWPVAALPTYLDWANGGPHAMRGWYDGDCYVSVHHAAALHVASAVAYVLALPHGSIFIGRQDGQVLVWALDSKGLGPTELHALSAALLALTPDPG